MKWKYRSRYTYQENELIHNFTYRMGHWLKSVWVVRDSSHINHWHTLCVCVKFVSLSKSSFHIALKKYWGLASTFALLKLHALFDLTSCVFYAESGRDWKTNCRWAFIGYWTCRVFTKVRYKLFVRFELCDEFSTEIKHVVNSRATRTLEKEGRTPCCLKSWKKNACRCFINFTQHPPPTPNKF